MNCNFAPIDDSLKLQETGPLAYSYSKQYCSGYGCQAILYLHLRCVQLAQMLLRLCIPHNLLLIDTPVLVCGSREFERLHEEDADHSDRRNANAYQPDDLEGFDKRVNDFGLKGLGELPDDGNDRIGAIHSGLVSSGEARDAVALLTCRKNRRIQP